MDELLKASMEFIRDCPEWMQNTNLVIACRSDASGTTEKLARMLADYGLPTEKILPCIMDIHMIFIESTE